MSYQNYKESLWMGTLLHECKAKSLYRADCWEEWDGKIESAGDEVIFKNIGTPTISHFDTEIVGTNPNVPDVETVPDTAMRMKIRQIDMYNFEVGDIDKVQGDPNLMKKLMSRAADGIASLQDAHIAAQAVKAPSVWSAGTASQKVVNGTASSGEMEVFDILDLCSQKLGENHVPADMKVVLNCSFRFLKYIRKAFRLLDTNNSDVMELGQVGRANNFIVKASANCAKSQDGSTDYLMVRTPYAVGFADGLERQRAYIPEKKLSDALKGAALYQAKILVPNEIFQIPVTY